MSFGHPLLLLTLLAAADRGAVYLWLERRPAKYAMTFTNVDVLAGVAGGRSLRRYVPPALALLALAALCVALARPHRTTLVASDRATVVLVIDVSGSMHATDVKPSRLAAAQSAVRTFLKKVPHNVRVGLIAFAGEPQVAAPPTTDLDVVRQGLDSLELLLRLRRNGDRRRDRRGGRPGQAAEPERRADDRVHADRDAKKSPVSILFLSDGHQTRGLLQPLEGAARAKAAGIPVYTIALGTPNGALDRPPRRLRRRRSAPGRRAGTDSRPARPGHAAADRADHRREVLRRPLGEGGRVGLLAPRLGRRARAGQARGDERVPRPGGDPARRRRGVLGARRAALALSITFAGVALKSRGAEEAAWNPAARRLPARRIRRPTTSPPPTETRSRRRSPAPAT